MRVKSLLALVLAVAMGVLMAAPVMAEESEIPAEYTKVKVFEGTYGFGDAEITAASNEDESAFYMTFVCFDEDQILEGTVEDGIVSVDFDLTGFLAGDAQLIWDDALASENPWESLGAEEEETVERGDIPEQYTKVKVFEGTYGFGDAEITTAANDDETAFYITFVCFDEDQILEGTVEDGIITVDYDLTGFVAKDGQLIWDDTIASEEKWLKIADEVEGVERGDIPEDYTKIKIFDGTYGFGDAEISAAANEDETAFYITFVCFDEDQILEGTIEDGIVSVDYDLTGFAAKDAQLIWDDAVAAEGEWLPIK